MFKFVSGFSYDCSKFVCGKMLRGFQGLGCLQCFPSVFGLFKVFFGRVSGLFRVFQMFFKIHQGLFGFHGFSVFRVFHGFHLSGFSVSFEFCQFVGAFFVFLSFFKGFQGFGVSGQGFRVQGLAFEAGVHPGFRA